MKVTVRDEKADSVTVDFYVSDTGIGVLSIKRLH